MPIWDHLRALRKVLLTSAYAIAAGTVGGWLLSDLIYRVLSEPASLLAGVNFVTTTPMESIIVKLKLSLVAGVIITAPIILWQLWSFVLPALHRSEKITVYIVAFPSILLFATGVAFAFLIVLPLCLKFLLFIGSDAIDFTPLLSKAAYLDFVLTFLLSFGVVFQLPVVLLALIRFDFVTPRKLAKFRKYAFFVIVVIAVVISPTPDLATQALMITPMYLLYEISIWLGYLLNWRRARRQARESEG
jgi:sec-independent protein translocase protein TatC